MVAVSGGVDSSTTLLFLQKQGYDVTAAYMKLWNYSEVGGDSFQDGRCCSLESINDLHIICNRESIPFYVMDFSKEFRELVIENFISEYKAGRTPNPCILCNTHLKWSYLIRKSIEIGCDYIATGHYAIIEYNSANRRYILKKGIDKTRDQSYALYGLSQESLALTLLPLGNYLKSEVREMAGKFALRTADKPESREICFVADDDYHRFIEEWEKKSNRQILPGNVVTKSGTVLGMHRGIPFYTIGQRKGLGISNPTPLYVNKINPDTHEIVVGDDCDLYTRELSVKNINWVSITPPAHEIKVEAKIRYLHRPASALVVPEGDEKAIVRFDTPQRAITPGQSAVFYDHDILLGGGIIEP